jgi:predicted nucleotidyltransferase
MLNPQDEMAILACARKYGAKSVYLFGSSITSDSANDVDLGVEGIRPGIFFRFYGELMMDVSKPVDLVDLNRDTTFSRLVLRDGKKIFG